jgi:RNA polymerase sigma-70 factor (ECF subfamily)
MSHRERERRFLDLLATHKQRLLRLCYGYLGTAEDVDDLFQEIMVNVWNGLPDFRGEAAIGTWLYRIAVNTALLYRRKQKPTEPLSDLPDGGKGAQQHLEDQERLSALREAISRLPGQDRLVVTLLLEGLSYREIAEITGLSVNHVGVKLTRIRKSIEEILMEVNHGRI